MAALPRLRICLDDVADGPTGDTAVSRALLERVDAGALPATLRLSRPPAVVAFSSRDARTPGFEAAVAATRAAGFEAVLRLAGGRPAVFTPATIAFAWSVPATTPAAGIAERFSVMATALRDACRSLGVDAHIGEVPGEYCPGEWSVNARGRVKVAGIGQRLLRRAAHTGGVLVVGDRARIVEVLDPVHAAMGLSWDPAAVGAVSEEVTTRWELVRDALVDAMARSYDLEPWSLDTATRELAGRLGSEHLAPPSPDLAAAP